MARNFRGQSQNAGEGFEHLVKRLVRETLQETFQNTQNQSEEISFSEPSNNMRRKRVSTAKGRVTDPNKDRRLKRNRQPEA